MTTATLVFPHQIFQANPSLAPNRIVYLVEEHLFFRHYKFHKQKLVFHRASMRAYHRFLAEQGYRCVYIDAAEIIADVRELIPVLKHKGITEIHFCEVADYWLEKRIGSTSSLYGIKHIQYDTPLFLNTKNDLKLFFKEKKKYSQTDFYVQQRKQRKVLLNEDSTPLGGKWTFDTENRKRYPKDRVPPAVRFLPKNNFVLEAERYVEKYFPGNPGEGISSFVFPTTFEESGDWLQQFLEERFAEFGEYEDAIVAKESVLNHSLLSAMLNVGMLTPQRVLAETLTFASNRNIPLNSCEGFVRQLMGWREFIRGVYEYKGRQERTTNFWKFTRKMPKSFWNGTTGILPVDQVIKRVLKTSYCHHIERLMVLGNFMLLCEFDPDEVHHWFMEMFIDAYDWVMVPNVYGMSQFSDGGLMATKPYISGSNYLMKMSDFPKGPWQAIWDGLFWRFMHVHRDFFLGNPRLGMLIRTFDKMPVEKRNQHLDEAEKFLSTL